MKSAPDRLDLPGGVPLLVESSFALPIVEVGVVVRAGSLADPPGEEGLGRMMGRLLRRGTATMSSNELEERLGLMGARLSVETGYHSMRIGGVVLARNIDDFAELMVEVLTAPAFRPRELAQAKRETLAALSQARDDDRYLAARSFREALYGSHPYGRPISGTPASIRNLTREKLFAHHARMVASRNMFFAISGALSAAEAETLVGGFFGDIPRGPRVKVRLPVPKRAQGRRVVLIDKPGRSQTQMYIGSLGSRVDDAHHDALAVGNTIFGGTFTSRLMSEVRAERGWSYGASSRLEVGRQRSPWSMWTHPAIEYSAECAALQLRLLDEWVSGGVSAEELRFAKRFLTNSHAFDIDTASKRLDGRVDAELFGIDPRELTRVPARVRKVSRPAVAEALRRRIYPNHALVSLVGPAKELEPAFAALPGVTQTQVIHYKKI